MQKPIIAGITKILQIREDVSYLEKAFDEAIKKYNLRTAEAQKDDLLNIRDFLVSDLSLRALFDVDDLLMSATSIGELLEALEFCNNESGLWCYADLLSNVKKLSQGITINPKDKYETNLVNMAKKLLHKHMPNITSEDIPNGAKILIRHKDLEHEVAVFGGYGIDLKDYVAVGNIQGAVSVGALNNNYLILKNIKRRSASFEYVDTIGLSHKVELSATQAVTVGDYTFVLAYTRFNAVYHKQWFSVPIGWSKTLCARVVTKSSK